MFIKRLAWLVWISAFGILIAGLAMAWGIVPVLPADWLFPTLFIFVGIAMMGLGLAVHAAQDNAPRVNKSHIQARARRWQAMAFEFESRSVHGRDGVASEDKRGDMIAAAALRFAVDDVLCALNHTGAYCEYGCSEDVSAVINQELMDRMRHRAAYARLRQEPTPPKPRPAEVSECAARWRSIAAHIKAQENTLTGDYDKGIVTALGHAADEVEAAMTYGDATEAGFRKTDSISHLAALMRVAVRPRRSNIHNN